MLFVMVPAQVYRQWRKGDRTRGRGSWFLVAQFVFASGVCVYNALERETLFATLKGVLATLALIGFVCVRVHRRREARRHEAEAATAQSGAAPRVPGPAPAGP